MGRASVREPAPVRAPARPADGPDPSSTPARVLSDAELDERCDGHPLAAVLPLCRELLAPAVEDAGVFAVADANGALLWVEGPRATRRRTERMGFGPGADWSERSAGTNAPGSALRLDAPVQVRGAEHFLDRVKPWSCAAAPVHDPDTGATLGALDITGGPEVGGCQALALVRAAASAAEGELARRTAAADLRAIAGYRDRPGSQGPSALVTAGGRVLEASWPAPARLSPALLAPALLAPSGGAASGPDVVVLPDGRRLEVEPWGPHGHVVARLVVETREPATAGRLEVLGRGSAVLDVDGHRVRLSPRHSEITWLLSRAEDGLSAARLAVQLSEAEIATGTIRVDMSRLRDVLGAELIGSLPYRLLRPVVGDDSVVAALLADGQVVAALAAYRGPLLPLSESPAVVEHRDALHLQLRAAVLATGSPALVRSWAESPWGEDDVGAWQQLAGLLPPGSPQRAAAAARVGHHAG